LVCSDIEMGSQSVDDFWVDGARNNDGRFHEFQWIDLQGGFKFEAQCAWLMDEKPCRIIGQKNASLEPYEAHDDEQR